MTVDFDVVDLGPADHPIQGDRAPDFTRPLVNAEFWENRSLSEITDEGPILLVFYPMDGEFPAIYMWNEIRDRSWDDRYRVSIVGLSISSPYEHKRFIEEHGIDYPLFSDPKNDVARRYGIVHDLDGMAGISEPRPAIFLIDDAGIVVDSWVTDEWPEFPDYDGIESVIATV